MEDLSVLDVASLPASQLKAAVKAFDDLKNEKLLSFHELGHDPVRRKLDERFAVEVLGLPSAVVKSGCALDLVRIKLVQEPSVRGGKVTEDEEED